MRKSGKRQNGKIYSLFERKQLSYLSSVFFSANCNSCSFVELYYFFFFVLSTLIVSGIGSGPSVCLENLKQISILLNRFPNQLELHFRFIIERVNHTTPAAHPLHVLSEPWVYPHHIHIWSSLCSASLVFCHRGGCPGPAGGCQAYMNSVFQFYFQILH